MRQPFQVLDVFTTERFAGNPLAVVTETDGLAPEDMRRIAREFNLSETIFVQQPESAAHTAKVRIFLPVAEIPFAGHPTIGCQILLAEKQAGTEGDFERILTLEAQAGLVPVRVTRQGAAVTAMFTAPGTQVNSIRGRMFAPRTGIPEDPATGSATACLAGQLHAAGMLKEGINRFEVEQGYEMGRPSQLVLEIDRADGMLAAVRVAGAAVYVSEGCKKAEIE